MLSCLWESVHSIASAFVDDPVYMPLESQKREYIKSDYGMVYMGSHLNITKRPWLFGQVCDTEHATFVEYVLYNHIIMW